jgi:hypothetical protein
MNMDYEKNLQDALLKLQESLNDIVKNIYLLGVNDGYKLGQKGEKPSDDTIVEDSKALQEAEKILREHPES